MRKRFLQTGHCNLRWYKLHVRGTTNLDSLCKDKSKLFVDSSVTQELMANNENGLCECETRWKHSKLETVSCYRTVGWLRFRHFQIFTCQSFFNK